MSDNYALERKAGSIFGSGSRVQAQLTLPRLFPGLGRPNKWVVARGWKHRMRRPCISSKVIFMGRKARPGGAEPTKHMYKNQTALVWNLFTAFASHYKQSPLTLSRELGYLSGLVSERKI